MSGDDELVRVDRDDAIFAIRMAIRRSLPSFKSLAKRNSSNWHLDPDGDRHAAEALYKELCESGSRYVICGKPAQSHIQPRMSWMKPPGTEGADDAT